ncbi:MAG: hypothetical protein K6C97_06105 [Treponema sp.]|nr:hypothetical protein [Treponema sp.]
MRKIFTFGFILSLLLIFTSCADSLNTLFPNASSALAEESGVSYGNGSSGSGSGTSSSSTTVSGTFSSGSDYDIYYFTTSSGSYYYNFSWSNLNGGEAAVSVATSSTFSSSSLKYDNTVTTPVSLLVSGSKTIYIKVKPRGGYTYYAGGYNLTVKKGSTPVSLTLYRRSR